jgi:hypothetical protein
VTHGKSFSIRTLGLVILVGMTAGLAAAAFAAEPRRPFRDY